MPVLLFPLQCEWVNLTAQSQQWGGNLPSGMSLKYR